MLYPGGRIAAVDNGAFWGVIEAARARSTLGMPFDQALVGYLATRPRQDILEFQQRFDQMHAALYRWDAWAAAYLIGGGCSADGFIDFRAGLIAQGSEWYEKVTASPDSLADHPALADAPACIQGEPLFYETVNYAAAGAFERATGAGRQRFYDALRRYDGSGGHPGPAGEDFDFDDDHEMRRRLPCLSALCLPHGSA
jgi:hypothetical protein